ncbi:NAD(P)H-binding protein [Rhodopseudomonas sp. HC1]|uniref:NAD-dependent epimerase/dehydratase family protein n=1 Tax=Rhodopseudomonas infernalis TaxID=2897386 RepID=UPI001EE93318|nr:NAD-dependent epimerase/dehydratase family protein [Rhodopseudomonas infernalis]MCG6204124.1 NAD(P)H-binding protein [Rhodopseudomonas infernalis]
MTIALVFGATGFIGSQLLRGLLSSPDYTRVIAVTRRPLALSDPKLTVLIGDLGTLPALATQLEADEVFVALGTTRKQTPDEAAYYRIDHDYPVEATRIARRNGAHAAFLVTAVGADASSRSFYLRTKGETERDVIALGFPQTHIFRPSMLMGERGEHRPLEQLYIGLARLLNPLLAGPADRFRGIDGGDVARAMVAAARTDAPSPQIYHWREMMALLPN